MRFLLRILGLLRERPRSCPAPRRSRAPERTLTGKPPRFPVKANWAPRR